MITLVEFIMRQGHFGGVLGVWLLQWNIIMRQDHSGGNGSLWRKGHYGEESDWLLRILRSQSDSSPQWPYILSDLLPAINIIDRKNVPIGRYITQEMPMKMTKTLQRLSEGNVGNHRLQLVGIQKSTDVNVIFVETVLQTHLSPTQTHRKSAPKHTHVIKKQVIMRIYSQ